MGWRGPAARLPVTVCCVLERRSRRSEESVATRDWRRPCRVRRVWPWARCLCTPTTLLVSARLGKPEHMTNTHNARKRNTIFTDDTHLAHNAERRCTHVSCHDPRQSPTPPGGGHTNNSQARRRADSARAGARRGPKHKPAQRGPGPTAADRANPGTRRSCRRHTSICHMRQIPPEGLVMMTERPTRRKGTRRCSG